MCDTDSIIIGHRQIILWKKAPIHLVVYIGRGIQTMSGFDCFKVTIRFGCGFQFAQKPIYVYAKWYWGSD